MFKLISHKRQTLTAVVYLSSIFGCESLQPFADPPTQVTVVSIPTPEYVHTTSKVIIDHGEEVAFLRQRLVESYARYWPLISTSHQHEQLPHVLNDQISELRAFGVERIGVLLRDGEATVEELQLVVDRLIDEEPTVRLAAAKLLPEINIVGLSEIVAAQLARETEIEVVTQELEFFQTRPHPDAINPSISRLKTSPIEPAAKTLIVLLNTSKVPSEVAHQIVQIVQDKRKHIDYPSLITLEAMLGNRVTQRKLIPLLRSQNESVKFAVAKGFASAGFADPLMLRKNDPTMYPFALTALQKEPNIDSFKELMSLYQSETPIWDAAAFAIATSLETSQLLRADDMLKRSGLQTLRLTILKSIWEQEPARELAARKAIARRAAPLMIEIGDAVGALQLLDAFGESLVDDDFLELRFTAAIAASAWDAAADAYPKPQQWILKWNILKNEDPAVATVIRQQILQRFEDILTSSERETLGIKQANVPHPDETP